MMTGMTLNIGQNGTIIKKRATMKKQRILWEKSENRVFLKLVDFVNNLCYAIIPTEQWDEERKISCLWRKGLTDMKNQNTIFTDSQTDRQTVRRDRVSVWNQDI